MNQELGRVVDAVMIDENEDYYFVQPSRNGQTYRLLKEESPQVLHIGGSVRGFVYENEDHQRQMTCQHIPAVRVDHYAFGTVVGVRRNLGVFVDVGLPNKDIAVSLDDLPAMKTLWPQKGDRLMISLKVDDHDRLWGQLATPDLFQVIAQKPQRQQMNADVEATVTQVKLNGTHVITDTYQLGFIHPSERDEEPRLGQVLRARVIGFSNHGGLNLSLKPRGYQAIDDDSQMILAMLRHSVEGTLPLSDKSSPADIKVLLGISKGQFKRAVGHLLKAKLITQSDGQLRLVSNQEDQRDE